MLETKKENRMKLRIIHSDRETDRARDRLTHKYSHRHTETGRHTKREEDGKKYRGKGIEHPTEREEENEEKERVWQ